MGRKIFWKKWIKSVKYWHLSLVFFLDFALFSLWVEWRVEISLANPNIKIYQDDTCWFKSHRSPHSLFLKKSEVAYKPASWKGKWVFCCPVKPLNVCSCPDNNWTEERVGRGLQRCTSRLVIYPFDFTFKIWIFAGRPLDFLVHVSLRNVLKHSLKMYRKAWLQGF